MFKELANLVQSSGKVTVTIFNGTEGKLKVCVTPDSKAKKDEAALSQPLILVATPEALDEGFAAAVSGYEGSHKSLMEQVEATKAILDNAKKNQETKAVKAVTGKKQNKAAAVAKDDDDDHENDESPKTEENDQTSVSETAATPANAGTDLSSLL